MGRGPDKVWQDFGVQLRPGSCSGDFRFICHLPPGFSHCSSTNATAAQDWSPGNIHDGSTVSKNPYSWENDSFNMKEVPLLQVLSV